MDRLRHAYKNETNLSCEPLGLIFSIAAIFTYPSSVVAFGSSQMEIEPPSNDKIRPTIQCQAIRDVMNS